MSKSIACRLCNSNTEFGFEKRVLNKYDVGYFFCRTCGLLQTEEPYWLNEAYQEAINVVDTGIMQRNQMFEKMVTAFLLKLGHASEQVLDFAGGYGILVRMLRDRGIDCYWTDKYCQNLLARGFEHKEGQTYAAVTSFECLEHMASPSKDLNEILGYCKGNTFLCSTVLYDAVEKLQDWWYLGSDHGQHVAFYAKKPLDFIAGQHDLRVWTDSNAFHVFYPKTVQLRQSDRKMDVIKRKIKMKLGVGGLKDFDSFDSIAKNAHIIADQHSGKFLKSLTWQDYELLSKR